MHFCVEASRLEQLSNGLDGNEGKGSSDLSDDIYFIGSNYLSKGAPSHTRT